MDISAAALLTAGVTVGTSLLLAGTAQAGVPDCEVGLGGENGKGGGVATCPAGAGTFTFRVAVDCYDAYPNLHFQGRKCGTWVQASATSTTRSAVTCYGYVPGSGSG